MIDGPARVQRALCRYRFRLADVVEATGHQQSGESAQKALAAVARAVVQPWRPQTRRAVPGERLSVDRQPPDVEAAVDHHFEFESAAGAKFQQADAAFMAIAQRDESNAAM